MAEVTIYALCDPETGAWRYIGKANDLAARLRCHKWEARSSRLHTRKVNWLRSLPCDPKVVVLDICTKETWAASERRWIAESRERGDNLTNFADGGETSPVEGKGHTEETKAKLREIMLRNGNRPPSHKGVRASASTLLKLSIASRQRGAIPPPMGGWNKGIIKTHCPSGHEYSPENTRVVPKRKENRVYQACKTCSRAQAKAYQQRRAA